MEAPMPETHSHVTAPTARQLDDANAVVNSPALVADHPSLRASAWEILMAERGHRVNLVRLSAMQHTLRNTRTLGAHLLNPGAV
jgi:hypothetical protein